MFFRKPKKTVRVSPIEKLEDRQLMSATYGANLIVNPGAESYSGNANGLNIITPNGWTASGAPTVIQYGNGYANKANVQKASNGGVAFFAGGPISRSDDFFQTIDISPLSGAIQAGQVNFALSAAIGGKGTDNDTATVSVIFLDASQNVISRASTPIVSRGQRSNRSKFLRQSKDGTVPTNAVFAKIDIHFQRYDGTYNDGYADNLSLVLATNTPSFLGVIPSIVQSTLKPQVVTGNKISGKLVVNLENPSTSNNSGIDTVSVYYSTSGVVDSGGTLVKSVKQQISLVPGQNLNIPVTIPISGLLLPAGAYTFFVRASDSLNIVNTATSGTAVTVSAPFVSLSASVGAVSPAAAVGGTTISFTLSILNNGNINSTGAATIAIGLSSDGRTIAIPVATLIKRITIATGGIPVALLLKVKLPAGTPVGVFVPIVTFMQGLSSVTGVGSTPVIVPT